MSRRTTPHGSALSLTLTTLSSLLFALESAEGQRVVPPVDTMPRTWQAWRDESAQPWRNLPRSEQPPEYIAKLDSVIARTREVIDRSKSSMLTWDEGTADELVAELYIEEGNPLLNLARQRIILAVISDVARFPDERLPTAARNVLTSGVLDYAAAGGGRNDPAQEADLAETLDRLAADDPRVQIATEELLQDALNWAAAVEEQAETWAVYRVAEKHWGDSFVLRVPQTGGAIDVPPERRPKKYTEAVAALEALLADPGPPRSELSRRVREATALSLQDMGEEKLEADLTSRILVVYRRLLLRRPEIPERLCDYIDNRLLGLAAKSGRLKTDKDWMLWAQAVNALGHARVSKSLDSFARHLLEQKDLTPDRRKAVEPSLKAFFQH
jgi:hypothetical protein